MTDKPDWLDSLDPGGELCAKLCHDLLTTIFASGVHPHVAIKALVWALASLCGEAPAAESEAWQRALPGALAQMVKTYRGDDTTH